MINLISDTVTQPTAGMLQAMMAAKVGDDVFKEDPTVNELEQRAAEMFGHEAALFCPSGTMCNQIAIKLHTKPLDEVLCEQLSHIYRAEGASYAWHSGVGLSLLPGKNGILDAQQLAPAILPKADWLPRTTLLVVENTANLGGGGYYTLEQLKAISEEARSLGLALHLDGARIFNAAVAGNYSMAHVGPLFDTLSVCLSKGLGAPVGSLLIGSQAHIHEARRLRKALGGGMRQIGFLAAAGIYALENNIQRLSDDHLHAQQIAAALHAHPNVHTIRPVATNIIIFDTTCTAAEFIEALLQHQIRASAFGPHTVRMVTHLHIGAEQVAQVIESLSEIHF